MNERIIFLGTPAIAATVLKGMKEAGFNIVGVVTKEDKVRGRHNKVEESPVATMARELGIPCHKPHRLNKDFEFIKELNPDLLLTFSYGQLISDEVLALGKFKPLNLHGSLLPKYRGASPMQAALRNGDEKTGVSLMEMVHEMDAGDVFAVKEIPLTIKDNYTSLCEKMASAALELAIEALPKFFAGELTPVKQDEGLATFTHMIPKEDEHLLLDVTPLEFINQVRSLSEEPGAYLYWNDEVIKIFEAEEYVDETKNVPGLVVLAKKKNIVLSLGKGKVRILSIQRQGKKRMSASDFNNGVRDFEGAILK
jgi:methionyl-tRNA formyltransferase